jgi:ribonuclease HII
VILSHAQEWGLKQIAAAGGEYIVGIDEVGLGACAGPLVVCAAVFPFGWSHPEVKDSKKYTGDWAHQKRCKVAKEIIQPACLFRTYEIVPHDDIDALGMGAALEDAMRRAAVSCTHLFPGSTVVVDGVNRPLLQRARLTVAIPEGDSLVPAVSAASVLAKSTRDSMMIMHESIYPGYGFDQHMGYYTEKHAQALRELGPCKIHRRSYKNVARIIREREIAMVR